MEPLYYVQFSLPLWSHPDGEGGQLTHSLKHKGERLRVPDYFVLGRLVTAIHRAAPNGEGMDDNGRPLKRPFALAFPEMDEGRNYLRGEAPTLGTVLRVFSPDPDTLRVMMANREVERIVRDGCPATPIAQVPDVILSALGTKWVRYRRDRSMDNLSLSAVRRLVRRCRDRGGEQAHPDIAACVAGKMSVEEVAGKWREQATRDRALFFDGESRSTGQMVRFFVRREWVEKGFQGVGFSGYGFSLGGAVPDF